jgi:hypothetical protein
VMPVPLEAGDDVQVDMEHILPSDTPIGQE